MPDFVSESQITSLVAELKSQLAAQDARIVALETAPPGSVQSVEVGLSAVNLNANTTGVTLPLTAPGSPPAWLTVAGNNISLTIGEYLVLFDASMSSTGQRTNVGWRFNGSNRHGKNYIRAVSGHNEASDSMFWRVTGPITSNLRSYRQTTRTTAVNLDPARSELVIVKLA